MKAISDFIYDIRVRLHSRFGRNKQRGMSGKKKGEILFMFAIFFIPCVNFLLLYVAVNANHLMLVFQKYDTTSQTFKFAGLENIIRVVKDLVSDKVVLMSLGKSLLLYAWSIFFALPTSLLISYSIYKRVPGHSVFRVVLFLPSVISSIVWVIVFKYMVEHIIPAIFPSAGVMSLIINPETSFQTLLFYQLWMGFAGHLIIYLGSMSRIPDSLIEYGKLEGLSMIKEFWHIVLPLIFPTISVFIVTGVVSIFTNQMSTYAFFGADAGYEMYTLGYYFFVKVFGSRSSYAEYPYAAAAGVVFSAIVIPLTFFIKRMLEKFGPSEEY